VQVEWSFTGSADPQTSAAVLPDGEDVELEEQGFIGIMASECMVLSPKKLARSPLLIALAMDWKETIRDLDPQARSRMRSGQSSGANGGFLPEPIKLTQTLFRHGMSLD
jgi:hypothetical protein